MLISPSSLAPFAVIIVGAVILWSNSSRWVNRLVFTCSLHIAAWLACHHFAVSIVGALFWLKMACAVSAWIPFHYWLIKESIVGRRFSVGQWVRRLAPWVVLSSLLAIVCFTEYFIPSHSTPANRIRGWGYYSYIVIVALLYGFVFFDAHRALRSLSGAERLALQVWLWGGCAAAVTILLMMTLDAVMRSSNRLQSLVVLAYYSITAFAITTHRIFDARQLLLIGASKSFLVMAVAGIGYLVNGAVTDFIPQPFDSLTTTAISLWAAVLLNRRLDRVLHFIPEATAARQAAFSAAQRESRVEALEAAFCSVLKGWGQSEHALILSGSKDVFAGGGVSLAEGSAAARTMRELRWATPERLSRERSSFDRAELAQFLGEHRLGVLVVSEGPSLSILVGVGATASRRPYTYPQVTQLMELASIMESALERAHFSAKVQHTEQLATVGLLGASLAHEIRNPLVSIKTFVQLLPTHHADPRFREKFFRLIGDEVGRIDQLTQQLLDLASPRTYMAEMIDLHPLLQSSIELVSAKAAHRNVQLLTELQAVPDKAFTDASAAKQVMLNLCFNAIQAVETTESEDRWVKIATRNTTRGLEMVVADSGPGISPEIRPKLFQPFSTTKSTGFGLGLAICSDILANLNASISVDPSEPGRGATFRVIFPCQPSSS